MEVTVHQPKPANGATTSRIALGVTRGACHGECKGKISIPKRPFVHTVVPKARSNDPASQLTEAVRSIPGANYSSCGSVATRTRISYSYPTKDIKNQLLWRITHGVAAILPHDSVTLLREKVSTPKSYLALGPTIAALSTDNTPD
ncbi:hypothetical protein MGYG_09075 [Nannizzia gypsea CBS 118893]|uniref:Uncharacterized protein n=1 Tax=Arthroderma gypseum (strain ATCC MYA-4604 / CBS 118893) TaxID=535722 RepID=E4UVE7_ARTGP|nr:hypothetical protein MGYG_09075 [Nannizzia gypsea CBS 118893]EFR02274.1 hypothetical protein MGYG_09075 [Nannizzia gypsea CBS 118893]